MDKLPCRPSWAGRAFKPEDPELEHLFIDHNCHKCVKQNPDPIDPPYCSLLGFDAYEFPAEWQYGADGTPTCTAREPWDWKADGDPHDPFNPKAEIRLARTNPNQLSLL